MKTKLHIDIETYSSEDIRACGAYKYAESFDFEILLIAYAFENRGVKSEVNIVDIARGESMPDEFLSAFNDPEVEKHAHNATFERNCFREVGMDRPIEEWHCSMIKSAYCSLPLDLDQVTKVLNLNNDGKGKLAEGKALIKYFCCPCKPTRANGMRHRNLPHHNLEKWRRFKEYCKQDVIAEMAVSERLSPYKIPIFERENYIVDQTINDRGIEIDLILARNAYDIDSYHSAKLKTELQGITGLENSNSPVQLKKWLGLKMGKTINSLNKEVLDDLIESTDLGEVKAALGLRKKLAKTSIKKYSAMLSAAGSDDRARGLFQFYGANRTGRWAGRIIQLQNLPRNYLKDLDGARNLVLNRDYNGLREQYDNIPSTLSQLIRTAFIAKKNNTFAVADYSAIEARVIAWLANERWRLDVFNSHGKIYEASAAMMFNVAIEEVTKGSDLRAKGKIAELALGYGGSLGALVKMGSGKMGLSDSEMLNIVDIWRSTNYHIVQMWKGFDKNAKQVLRTGGEVVSNYKGVAFKYEKDALTIKLPSGRKLFYWQPAFTVNKFGSESIRYRGMDQETKQWGWVETYGGKLTENIVQAISRDLLAVALKDLHKLGFKTVMHVHDEVVCEIKSIDEDQKLAEICEIMSYGTGWTEGLPLNAEGYLSRYYKKD